MKKFLYERTVYISTNIEDLFEFHTFPRNMSLVSPSNLHMELKEISDVPLKENSTLKIKFRFFIFSFKWEIKIVKFNPPFLISDHQEKGLFKYWSHDHLFERYANGVKMTDKIEFVPPLGIIGWFFLPVIYQQVNLLFIIRHIKTKKYFERK